MPSSQPPSQAAAPWLVVTTVATHDQAGELARAMVEQRLAACAQISRIDSYYRWQGAVEHADEYRILFKTRAGGYAALEAAIRARHPYQLPAIHAWPTAQAWGPYAEWVRAGTPPPASG
jgi:periplasmic divalent cation tolerance protein